MLIERISVKSVIVPSSLPEADYVINPSIGCEHGCVYCYARFMRRWAGENREWGEFLKIKENAPELVRKEIAKIPFGKTILLASVTDPYSPRNYPITRKILEAIVASSRSDLRVSILTKSTEVLKDVDLFLKLRAEVGVSLSTLDAKIASLFEPRVPSPEARLNALLRLGKQGVDTYCFVGPILPGITLIEKTIREVAKRKPLFIMAEGLNLKGGTYSRIRRIYEKSFPQSLAALEQARRNPKVFWQPIEERLKQLAKEESLVIKTYFHSY